MTIRQQASAFFARAASGIRNILGSGKSVAGLLFSSIYGGVVRRDSEGWFQAFGRHPWTHAIVRRLAEDVASAPFHIYRAGPATPPKRGTSPWARTRTLYQTWDEGGSVIIRSQQWERKQYSYMLQRSGIGGRKDESGEPVLGHPAQTLLDHPNPYFSGIQMREFLQTCDELVGEWFVLKDRAETSDDIVYLWPLKTTWVLRTPQLGDTDPYFEIKLGANAWRVERSEIIWHRRVDPNDPYNRGLGTAMAVNDEVAADEQAAKWNERYFENSGRPEVALVFEDRISSQDEADAIRDRYMRTSGGINNVGKPALIAGKLKDIKILSSGHKDMDWPQLRIAMRDTLRAVWSMPGSMLGLMDDVNRSNSEAAQDNYARHNIIRRLVGMAEAFNSDLMPEFAQTEGDCWIEYEDPVPENRAADIDEATKLYVAGLITKNEGRTRLSYPPDDAGDVYTVGTSAAQTLFCPINEPAPAPVSATPPQAPNRASVAYIRRDIGQKILRRLVERTEPNEEPFKRALKKVFDKQEAAVLKTVRKRSIERSIGSAGDWHDEWDPEMQDAAADPFASAFGDGGSDAYSTVGASGSFDAKSPTARKFLADRAQRFAKQVNETTWSALKDTIGEGMDKGEGVADIEKRVVDTMNIARGARSQTIARTELVGAYNGGALEGYTQSGVQRKAWLTAEDDRVRDTHLLAGSQYDEAHAVAIDDDFEVGGGSGPAPGQIGDPSEDCNCRCTIYPVMEG